MMQMKLLSQGRRDAAVSVMSDLIARIGRCLAIR